MSKVMGEEEDSSRGIFDGLEGKEMISRESQCGEDYHSEM